MKLVVTGSSSGIGGFLAESLVNRGHDVCRLARSRQDGFSFPCDVSDGSALQNCARTISEKWEAVDDNAFLSLCTAKGQTAWLDVNCTEWKSLFSFEIYGRNAKLQIDGLGGRDGVEKL